MQSDTWALATAETRPWLLMLWTTAWQQAPCGSMPGDDALICARLGMPAKAFAKAKAVLLRGWWLAEDGRLYHPTITTRVLAMLGAKDKERQRKAEWRAKMDAERKARESQSSPGMSHGTDTGQTRDSTVSDDTGTGTGTGTGLKEESNTHTESISGHAAQTTPAGRVCRLMKSKGISDVSPGNADLLMLIQAGASDDEFIHAAEVAVKAGKRFSYALGVVKGQRKEAAQMAKGLHRGPMPQAPPSRKERQLTTAALMTGAAPKATPKAFHDDIDIDARIIENAAPRLGQTPLG